MDINSDGTPFDCRPFVNRWRPTRRSYQCESPFLIRRNWSVSKQVNSGPSIAPSIGGSLRAPVYTSISSISLNSTRKSNVFKMQSKTESHINQTCILVSCFAPNRHQRLDSGHSMCWQMAVDSTFATQRKMAARDHGRVGYSMKPNPNRVYAFVVAYPPAPEPRIISALTRWWNIDLIWPKML